MAAVGGGWWVVEGEGVVGGLKDNRSTHLIGRRAPFSGAAYLPSFFLPSFFFFNGCYHVIGRRGFRSSLIDNRFVRRVWLTLLLPGSVEVLLVF